MSAVVVASDVVKKFGGFVAVDNLSFSIRAGECFGLLGPNGAGKSTMISMLYGAAARSGGQLQVFGLDPETDAKHIKKRIGVVTQENALDEALTVVENMRVFAGYSGLDALEADQRIEELLNFMLLEQKKNAPIRSLSGGMQRRLVFVRALLPKPDLVILDEPTTGLDPAVRHLLWEKIISLKQSGVTILLTTHYMDEAERLCDRLVIMDNGKIRAEGHPKDLIAQNCPGYVALFENRPEIRNILSQVGPPHEFAFAEESQQLALRHQRLDALTEVIKQKGLDCTFIRPSNLEDVFLHITGKELTGNA
ncbi:MAG: ABC transporter ATP-binding protein [Oligoflexales bacterium]